MGSIWARHPDSGTYWEKHCHRAVGKASLRPTSNWPNCPFHYKLKFSPVVCVDDFKPAGPSANMAAGRALPRALLQLEDPAPVHLHVRCLHEHREVATSNNATARAIVYNMEGYLRNTVAKHCDSVRGITGRPPALRQVSTPFPPGGL